MFKAIDLPYDFDALEPHIDAKTMQIHHGKHYAGYTNNLNNALEGSGFEDKELVDLLGDLASLPEDIRGAVRNNGGGYANHTLFWEIMSPEETTIEGDLEKALVSTFGSIDDFKDKFTTAAATHFGSGWAWLTVENGSLHICTTPNQDTPLMEGNIPILGVDVWEHAYYLKYQNLRADYIKAWWNVVNWGKVAENFEKAK